VYKFIKTPDPDNHFECASVEMEVNTVDLHVLLEEFQGFLTACGFRINGEIDIVKEDK